MYIFSFVHTQIETERERVDLIGTLYRKSIIARKRPNDSHVWIILCVVCIYIEVWELDNAPAGIHIVKGVFPCGTSKNKSSLEESNISAYVFFSLVSFRSMDARRISLFRFQVGVSPIFAENPSKFEKISI